MVTAKTKGCMTKGMTVLEFRTRSLFPIRSSSTQKAGDVLEPVLTATKKHIMHDGGDLEGNRLSS